MISLFPPPSLAPTPRPFFEWLKLYRLDPLLQGLGFLKLRDEWKLTTHDL